MRSRIAVARARLIDLFDVAIKAVDPEQVTARALNSGDFRRPDALLAVGKAAPGMAWGVTRTMGHVPGLVISPTRAAVPPGVRQLVAAHPVPDRRSIAAAHAALELIGSLDKRCSLMVLMSGGASALVELPVAGLTLDDVVALNAALLRSGADINEMNAVRTAVSATKGGRLLEAARARVTTLAISDVVGNHAHVIGSGLTEPPPNGALHGADVLATRGTTLDLSPHIREAITAERRPARRGSDRFVLVASGVTAANAAAHSAKSEATAVSVLEQPITGDAAVQGRAFIDAADRRPPGLTVGHGETTVVLLGDGAGGRNQHAALAAAQAIEGRTDIAFLAGGSDGRDGPTEAAGAVVDGGSTERARSGGRNVAADLAAYDSNATLKAAGDLLITGPTGTNVGDLWMAIRNSTDS